MNQMPTMKKQIPSPRRKSSFIAKAQAGFSLIELLVVIAVIGIIAAIAIPNIGNLTGGAEIAKNQRNAQNLASVFSAARAAGNTNSIADVDAAITALTTSPGMTNASGATFYVPNLSSADVTGAKGYLSVPVGGANSQLIYNKAGSGTN